MAGQNAGDVRFEDPFRLNEWNELVIWLHENLSEEILEKVRVLLKDDDGNMEVDIENNEKSSSQIFFDTVDGGEDKLQAAKNLKDVCESHQIYHEYGENISEKVQTFIDRLKKYLNNFEVETKQLFIGRETELNLVVDLINDDKIFAVALCGIGGQGKSLLARRACMNLASCIKPWTLVKADLRNKQSTVDVIKSLLAAANGNFPMYGEQQQLLNVLKQAIYATKQDILFCLDDCDHVLRNDRHQFLKFLNAVTMESKNCNHKVKLLLTTRENLPGEGRKKDKYTLKLSGDLAEVELCELEQDDAVELLRACLNNKEIEPNIAQGIVKECAYSPLAVSVVAELIKSGKFTPERLVFHLQMDKKNVTKALKVDSCIKEAVNNLDNESQNALVSLSVFQSSPFDLESAMKVIGQTTTPTKVLQDMYNCHLLEVENNSGRSRDSKDESDIQYSLHPLVYRFISEWKDPKELKGAYQKFVSYYVKLISSIVKLLESKYWRGRKKLEFHKVHILKFYEIVAEHPKLLKNHPKKTDNKGILFKKRMSDLADILLSLVQNRRMFQSEADRALKSGNKDVYIFWMVEKADVFLMLHDKVEIALEYLDDLDKKYPALRDLREEPYHLELVHSLFHKVKGLCRWKQRRHDESLAHLQLAVTFCNQLQQQNGNGKTPYDIFVARIKFYMGQVYLEKKDYDMAEQYLKEGHSDTRRMVESRQQDQDELSQQLHWDIPRYYSLYAKIKLLKAKATKDKKERDKLLDEGLEDLETGIKLDELLKLDYLDGYYAKYKLKADINIEKGILMEALRDANNVLDKRRVILQPPHTHYTESVYQVGRIYMLIGNELDQKGDRANAIKHWNCSSDYFDELKTCHIKDGGISVDNPVFTDIQEDHIKVMNLTGIKENVKRIEHFYNDVKTGAYAPEKASSIKSMKEMLWTPVEMMKKWYLSDNAGGKQFGDNDQKITQMENLAREQEENMMRGDCSGGRRRDSGMGHSSSDLGDSFSSGSGSMSSRMDRLRLEKSISLEDDVFQDSGEMKTDTEKRRLSKKRQKTIKEDMEI